jgi:hypothetical protein
MTETILRPCCGLDVYVGEGTTGVKVGRRTVLVGPLPKDGRYLCVLLSVEPEIDGRAGRHGRSVGSTRDFPVSHKDTSNNGRFCRVGAQRRVLFAI